MEVKVRRELLLDVKNSRMINEVWFLGLFL